jgi:hypothetical protein
VISRAPWPSATKLASDDAKKAKDEFLARTQSKLARVKWLLDNGYPSDAEALIAKLEKSSKGVTEVTSKLARVHAGARRRRMKTEREASKALARSKRRSARTSPSTRATSRRCRPRGQVQRHQVRRARRALRGVVEGPR